MFRLPGPIRRRLTILAVCVLAPGLSSYLVARHRSDSQDPTITTIDAGGLVVRNAILNIGTVWSGGQGVQREFLIQNNTGHAIRVASVESDCGCTVAKSSRGDVPTGESAKVFVTFWPPNAANDLGGPFQRTITVVVSTISGSQTVPLTLTGSLAPDASLRVSPVNLDVETVYSSASPVAVLHFKGAKRLLAEIPDKLVVQPGSDRRVWVPAPNGSDDESIGTRDVEVMLTGSRSLHETSAWDSALVFAPDERSDGLCVHIHGRPPQPVMVKPRSLILWDDPAGRDGTVQIQAQDPSDTPNTVRTSLPVACEMRAGPMNGVKTLHVRVNRAVLNDISGTVQIGTTSNAGIWESVSIPVVILHRSN